MAAQESSTSREPGEGSREPGEGSREPGEGSREPGESPGRAPINPEVVEPDEVAEGEDAKKKPVPRGSVSEPAKVMRIGSMIRQLLEEVRVTELDDRGRVRLREIYDTSVDNLATALSPDLQEELYSLAMPFGDKDMPSDSELRIAQAQLVGWLEGLFHGIQTTIFAQQAAAQQQLEQMKAAKPLPGSKPNMPQTGTYL